MPIATTELTVHQLRNEAKRSTDQALTPGLSAASILLLTERTFQDARRSDAQQNLRDAYYKYLQGASMFSHAIKLEEVRQAPKSSDVQRRVAALGAQLEEEIVPRSSLIGQQLKELDARDSSINVSVKRNDAEPISNEVKPNASIFERMQSLQGAGMVVDLPKRLSKEIRPPYDLTSPTPSRTSPSQLWSSSHGTRVVDGKSPTNNTAVSPAEKVDGLHQSVIISTRSTSQAHSAADFSSPAIPNSHDYSSSQPSEDPSEVQFSTSYPSLDELNAQEENLLLPSVPSGDPGTSVGTEQKLRADTAPDKPIHPTAHIRPLNDDLLNEYRAPQLHHDLAYVARPNMATTSGPSSSSPETRLDTATPKLRGTLNLPGLPTTSSIFPKTLLDWIQTGYKILLLDARTRDQFEKERPQVEEIVCIEPSILMRPSLTSSQLESALVISPTEEQVLFSNRNQFDAVVIMDEGSQSIPPPPSPLSALVRAIFENEFRKALKRPPILLVGGMSGWKKDLGLAMTQVSKSTTSSEIPPHRLEDPPDSNQRLNHPVLSETLLAKTNQTTEAYSRTSQSHLPTIPNSFVESPPTPAVRYTRPASTTAASSFGTFSEGLRSPLANAAVPAPPPASFASSPSTRRRNEFVERWRPPYSSQPSSGSSVIDYPVLSPQNILSHPPVAASPPMDRQDRRPINPPLLSSYSTPKPAPLLIASNNPVTTWGDVEIGVSGLKNLGNTCYMNSTLQCLSATVPFVRFFKDGRWKTAVNMMNSLGSKGHAAQNFASIVSEMWRHEYTYLSPLTFRKGFCSRAPQFGGSNQHDAQEFLSSLLDDLHEDLNRVLQKPAPFTPSPEREAELERLPPQVASAQEWALYRTRNDSIVVDYFQGQFRNRLQCMTCQHTSTTYNAFMYLTLPLPSGRNSKASLYQCLDAFVGEEIMDKGDAWNCSKCKALRTATKQLSLSRLPPVLMIQLKRFSFNGPFTDKLETAVDYPVHGLDLSRFMPPPLSTEDNDSLPAGDPRRQEPPYLYDLYAVTNHFGTLSTGHYTAFIASKGQWLLCDDSKVTEVNESDVVGRPAYILYYKRRNLSSRSA